MLWIGAALAYEPVPEAVAVSVSAGGLDRLAGALGDVLPESFTIGALGGEFACDEADPTATLVFAIDGLDVLLHMDDLRILPSSGQLDIALYGSIDSTATTLSASGACPPLTELNEVCGVQLSTTPLEAHFSMSLSLVDGVVDATVNEISFTLGAITNPVSDCTVASAIGTLLGQNPYALTDLLQSQIDPSLADLAPSLESSVEEALAGLVLETSFDVTSATVGLSVAPTAIDIDEDGLTLVLGGTVSGGEPSDCVPAATPPVPDSDLPILDGSGPGDLDYDLAAVVSKDFADQVLHAVYEAGGLCLDASALAGIALDSSLFGSVFGEEWSSLFPDSVPVALIIQPSAAPTLRFEEDGAPVRLDLNGLGLRAFAELDGREARVFSIAMDGEIGIDLAFADGTLSPALLLDTEALGLREEDHELLSEGYADGLATLLPTILEAALPADLLPSFALPSWQGIGVEHIFFIPVSGGEWLGAWVVIDIDNVQPLEVAGCEGGTLGCDGESSVEFDIESVLGCSDESGCAGTEGCSEGCSGEGSGCTTIPVRPFLLGAALGLGLLRRRR
ncbi:MAG: hypothetical protein FJ090_04230 [Deltaproteobacteria bacterium]|nr:hypothetical protein [Deltaproteobacteria bacterium]